MPQVQIHAIALRRLKLGHQTEIRTLASVIRTQLLMMVQRLECKKLWRSQSIDFSGCQIKKRPFPSKRSGLPIDHSGRGHPEAAIAGSPADFSTKLPRKSWGQVKNIRLLIIEASNVLSTNVVAIGHRFRKTLLFKHSKGNELHLLKSLPLTSLKLGELCRFYEKQHARRVRA